MANVHSVVVNGTEYGFEDRNGKMIASGYDPSSSYEVGEYAVHEGNLYRCKTKITGGETWNSAHWDVKTLGADVAELMGDMSEIKPAVAQNTTDVGELKSVIGSVNDGNVFLFTKNRYIDTNPSSGPVDPTNPKPSSTYQCVAIPCSGEGGETFTITADTTGSNSHFYAWACVNSSGNIITGAKASAGESLKNEVHTTPAGTVYFVCNARMSSEAFLCKGESVPVKLKRMFSNIRPLTSDDDLNDIVDTGMYSWTNNTVPSVNDHNPTDRHAKLLVYGYGGSQRVQVVITAANVSDNKIYYRVYATNTWGAWIEVATASDVNSLSSIINDMKERVQYNSIAYACNGSGQGSGFTVSQNGNDATVTGTSTATSGQAYTKILITDHIAVWNASATPDSETVYPIKLLPEHTYRLKASVLSGTRDAGDGSGYLRFRVIDSQNTVKTETIVGIDDVQGESLFRSSGEYVQIRMMVARLMTVTNLTVRVDFEDVSIETIQTTLDQKVDAYIIPSYYNENNYLSSKIDNVLEHDLYNTSGDSFIFLTDYHAHKNTGHTPALVHRINDQTGVSKVLFGGDIGTSTGMSGIKKNANAFKTLRESIPNFYAVAGNHEWKVSDSSTPTAGYNMVYNYYISQMEAETSCMSDFGDYWIDSKGAKIRYFFLNQNISAILTDISLKWFMQELLQVPAGYGIVVVMHHAYHFKAVTNGGMATKFGDLRWSYSDPDVAGVAIRNLTVRRISQLLDAVRTRTTAKYALRPHINENNDRSQFYTPYKGDTQSNCGTYNPILSTFDENTTTVGEYTDIVTFDGSSMNTGVYPIAIFCGHKHEDSAYDPASASSISDMTDPDTVYLLNNVWYRYDRSPTSEHYGERVAMLPANGTPEGYSQIETVPPILVILTTTDCCELKHSEDPTVRTSGTITEQAFDIVQIDTTAKKVYCTRIGGGIDREFSYL